MSETPSLLRRAWTPVWRSFRRYLREHDGVRAAAIAYYGLLSFFPFVLLVGAASILFVGDDPKGARTFLDSIRAFAPFLDESFWEGVHSMVEGRGVLSGASLLILYLIASQVATATERALRTIFRVWAPPEATFRRRVLARMQAYLFALAALLVLGAFFLARNAATYLKLIGFRGADALGAILDLPVVFGSIAPSLTLGLVAYVLFRRVPGASVRPRWAAVGAGIFVLGHEAATLLQRLVQTSQLMSGASFYGPFLSLALLSIWVYWLASVLLFAAEVVAELNGNHAADVGRSARGRPWPSAGP